MELQSLLILFGISAAASMDSFSAVLAYSAAGIHIPPRSVWTLGLVSGGLLGLSVLAGAGWEPWALRRRSPVLCC